MFSLNNIKASPWSRKTSKRLWRWNGSWKWTFCGRGLNWQNCRAGWGVPTWFEWGQTPLFRRMPKLRWFSNFNFTKEYNIVNVSVLQYLASAGVLEINKEVLLEKWIIRYKNLWLKVLGDWEINSQITLKVSKITTSASEKIQKAGWKIEIV